MFVNLTQHRINVYTANYWTAAEPPEDIVVAADGRRYCLVLSIPPSGHHARVSSESIPVERKFGFEVVTNTYGSVTGLPDPSPGHNYIVSGMVLDALQGSRSDVYAPGPLLRDNSGQPVGCIGLRC